MMADEAPPDPPPPSAPPPSAPPAEPEALAPPLSLPAQLPLTCAAPPCIAWSSLTPDATQVPLRGGMGTVLKARWTRRGLDVAVKLLRASELGAADYAAAASALEAEAELLRVACEGGTNRFVVAQLGVARGAPSFEWKAFLGDDLALHASRAGASRGELIGLVMEWQRGGTLAARLHGGSVRWTARTHERLLLLERVALGVALLHSAVPQIVVHGDIKSDNVLLTIAGEPMLADFGLASLRRATAATQAAGASTARAAAGAYAGGTTSYKAPEMYRTRAAPALEASRSTDVYATATLCWEVLTGERPWAGYGEAERLVALGKGENLDWTRVPDDVPAALRALLERGVDADRSRRPTARELADGLRAARERLESGAFDVFLSHSWEGNAHAPVTRLVHRALREAGRRVWVDTTEIGLDMKAGMRAGVAASAAYVALVSRKFAASANCMLELREATRFAKPIVACVVEPDTSWWPPSKLGTELEREMAELACAPGRLLVDLRAAVVAAEWGPGSGESASPAQHALLDAPAAIPRLLHLIDEVLHDGAVDSSRRASVGSSGGASKGSGGANKGSGGGASDGSAGAGAGSFGSNDSVGTRALSSGGSADPSDPTANTSGDSVETRRASTLPAVVAAGAADLKEHRRGLGPRALSAGDPSPSDVDPLPVDAGTRDGLLLIEACYRKNAADARKLLEAGASHLTVAAGGWTALLRACEAGLDDIACGLIVRGADLRAVAGGRAALDIAEHSCGRESRTPSALAELRARGAPCARAVESSRLAAIAIDAAAAVSALKQFATDFGSAVAAAERIAILCQSTAGRSASLRARATAPLCALAVSPLVKTSAPAACAVAAALAGLGSDDVCAAALEPLPPAADGGATVAPTELTTPMERHLQRYWAVSYVRAIVRKFDAGQRSLVANRAPDALCELAVTDVVKGDAQACCCVATALGNIAAAMRGRAACHVAGAELVLVALASTGACRASAVASAACASALLNLANDSAGKAAIGHARGVEALAALASEDAVLGNAAAAEQVALALAKLSTTLYGRAASLSAKVPTVLVRLAASPAVLGNAEAAEAVARALRKIAFGPLCVASVLAAGGPAALTALAAADAVRNSAPASAQVVRALLLLSESRDGKAACIAAGAVPVLWRLMEIHSGAFAKTTTAVRAANMRLRRVPLSTYAWGKLQMLLVRGISLLLWRLLW